MDRFEQLDDAVRWTAVEIIDVEHDTVDARHLVSAGIGLVETRKLSTRLFGPVATEQLGHSLEVFPDLGHHPERLPIAALGDPVGDKPGELPCGGEVLEFPFECADVALADLQRRLYLTLPAFYDLADAFPQRLRLIQCLTDILFRP